MRGLAALFVLLHHAAVEMGMFGLPAWVVAALYPLRYGHQAVAVFIVLSGFSLMLPVVQAGEIRGGLRRYIGRRARRILPAYYVTLMATLLLFALVHLTPGTGRGQMDYALDAFDVKTILAHVFLVHDLNQAWLLAIDPPMWSVAVEWHIYFIFPALVFAWRRAGHSASLALSLAVTFAAIVLLGKTFSNDVCPWYTFLFAIGMLAASLKDGSPSTPSRLSRLLWCIVVAATLALIASVKVARGDTAIGLATGASLVYLARHDGGVWSLVGRGLGSRPAVFLGSISYSLYLIHFPLLSLAVYSMVNHGIGQGLGMAIMLFLVSPTIVALSWPFHLAFEKPFMVGFRKHPSRNVR
jgi:peptidoglycan/LPS O-acetylase OafA/YrhL